MTDTAPPTNELANVPTGFAPPSMAGDAPPGAHISDHQGVVDGPVVGAIPATQSMYEDVAHVPNVAPVDTAHQSVSHTVPAANVPSSGKAPKPAKAPAQVWDTNHPRPNATTTAQNVPPATTLAEADPGRPLPATPADNVPPVGDMGGLVDMLMDPVDQPVDATTKQSAPAKLKNGKGVHFNPHMPQRQVGNVPPRTPKYVSLLCY